MLQALVTLAVEASEEEPSKAAFYILGLALAAWAVIVSFVGIRGQATFPGSAGGRAGVMAISVALVLATLASAVLTA